jgi:amino acid transporter
VSPRRRGLSLASQLGLVVTEVGLLSPAVMWVSFVPMLLVATSYYYLNRVDPDCGTTFSWGTRAFGPVTGWIGGWVIVITDVVVMANLAAIAGRYTFLLFNANSLADSTCWVMLLGVIWIVLMTWICYVGIEISAKTQAFLLGAEIVILAIFAVVALWKVYTSDPVGSVQPSLSWLNPFNVYSTSALISGVLVAIFIYWGWDSLVSVNEETENAERTPGIAAIASTIILVAIYVVVSIAAQAFHGPEFLVKNSGDVLSALGKAVLGSPWDKLLIVAVLTSASAATQTTILPTSRTTLSMASHGAIPTYFGHIHPRYLTPSTSTLWMGGVSVVWYVVLTLVSQNVLDYSIAALGLMIAFYYGLTGFACVWFFRRNIRSVKGALLAGVLPFLAASASPTSS